MDRNANSEQFNSWITDWVFLYFKTVVVLKVSFRGYLPTCICWCCCTWTHEQGQDSLNSPAEPPGQSKNTCVASGSRRVPEVSTEWQHNRQRRELGIISNSTHEIIAFHSWSFTFKLKLMVVVYYHFLLHIFFVRGRWLILTSWINFKVNNYTLCI